MELNKVIWKEEIIKNTKGTLKEMICYDEFDRPLIRILLGNYDSKSRMYNMNVFKIYEIEFLNNNTDFIESLEILLKNKLDKLKNIILPYSYIYWNKILSESNVITTIYNKNKLDNKSKLSYTEILYLYGINLRKDIYDKSVFYKGFFSPNIDPRILKVLNTRDHQSDIESLSSVEIIEIISDSKYTGINYNVKIDDAKIIYKLGSLQYASDKLLSNPRFIKKFIDTSSITTNILKYTKDNINNNKNIVLTVLENKINDDFKYISKQLRNDKTVALLAVIKNGLMYEYVGESLKKDKDIIVNALIENKDAVKLIDSSLLHNNPELVNLVFILGIISDYSRFSNAEKEIINNKLLNLISLLPEYITNNYKFMNKVTKINEQTINFITDENTKKKLKRTLN